MSDKHGMPDMAMNADELYQEETFTDGRVGSIRRLTPVKSDGSVDDARKLRYSGHTQVMTEAGALPLSFEIEAGSLREAAAKFGEDARTALEDMVRRIEEMRREAAGSIITPGQGGRGQGGMGGPGGMPGGGIQIP
jgi:hypothetical protein